MANSKEPKTGLFIDKGRNGQWYWKLKSKNGKIIAGNGGFNNAANAIKSIKATHTFFMSHMVSFGIHNNVSKKIIILANSSVLRFIKKLSVPPANLKK